MGWVVVLMEVGCILGWVLSAGWLLNVRLLEDMHQSFIRVSILLSVAVWMKFWKFAYILRESRLHPSYIQLQKAKYMYPYSNSKWNILMFTCNLYFGCYVFPLIANPYTHIPMLFGGRSRSRSTQFMDCHWVTGFFAHHVQLTRKTKEVPVKNVNILKLMTLKTNGLSYIFAVLQLIQTHIQHTLSTMEAKQPFSHVIFLYLFEFYVVTGINCTIYWSQCNTRSTLQTYEMFAFFIHTHTCALIYIRK